MMENQLLLPMPPYLLAVDPIPITLAQLVKALSKVLGQNKTKMINAEEAFLYTNMNVL